MSQFTDSQSARSFFPFAWKNKGRCFRLGEAKWSKDCGATWRAVINVWFLAPRGFMRGDPMAPRLFGRWVHYPVISPAPPVSVLRNISTAIEIKLIVASAGVNKNACCYCNPLIMYVSTMPNVSRWSRALGGAKRSDSLSWSRPAN